MKSKCEFCFETVTSKKKFTFDTFAFAQAFSSRIFNSDGYR